MKEMTCNGMPLQCDASYGMTCSRAAHEWAPREWGLDAMGSL